MRQVPNQLTNYVLEQDEHLKNLQKIIVRDFFPALGHLHAEQPAPNITLNTYLSNFKSDENEIFTKIVQDDAKEWKQKHWWIEHGLTKEEAKQKMLTASETGKQYSNMLQGTKCNNLMITPAEDKNNLFFNPDISFKDVVMDKYDNEKKIVYENTRFDQAERVLEFAATSNRAANLIEYAQDSKVLSTPLLQGIEDQEIKKKQKYTLDAGADDGFQRPLVKKRLGLSVGGYKIMTIPSPSPNVMQSPLMTYGEVEDTPQRLPDYKIPQTPQRQLLLQKLNKNINNKKKQEKTKRQSTVTRLLNLNTPNSLKSSLLKMKNTSSYRKPAPDSSVRQKNVEGGNSNLEGLLKL